MFDTAKLQPHDWPRWLSGRASASKPEDPGSTLGRVTPKTGSCCCPVWRSGIWDYSNGWSARYQYNGLGEEACWVSSACRLGEAAPEKRAVEIRPASRRHRLQMTEILLSRALYPKQSINQCNCTLLKTRQNTNASAWPFDLKWRLPVYMRITDAHAHIIDRKIRCYLMSKRRVGVFWKHTNTQARYFDIKCRIPECV